MVITLIGAPSQNNYLLETFDKDMFAGRDVVLTGLLEMLGDNTHDKNLVLVDRFRINIEKNIINGSLTTNFQKASGGEKIEVSAQPVGGYELDTIIVRMN